MNRTLKLLRIIGSPFTSDQESPRSKNEVLELYDYAIKNKIGLLYLESLKNQKKIEKFGLESKYEEEQKKHDEQLTTAIRISELFNSFDVNYAIFKSIVPFAATLNDVDIIHFGSDEEYKNAVEIMLRSGYKEVKGPVDASQRMFHDARACEHLDPRKKDVYDIDLYQKIAASYIIYLDRRKLEKYVTEINMSGDKIKVLSPEAELVAIIIHSIIPEMLHTLFVYYATLHYLAKMNPEGINKFVYIAKENNVTFAVRTHCSLVAELHRVAHGFVPEELERILAELGDEMSEKTNLLKNNNLKMPHKYSLSTVIRILLEKTKEAEFRRSAIRQAVNMRNIKLVKWVIDEIIWRRRRETY